MGSWSARGRGILLVLGLPGSGKSVLVKQLVRQMPEALQPQATRVVHYFVRLESFGNTCDNIMASFLHQISKETAAPIKYAIRNFRALGEDFVGSFDMLTRMFSDVIVHAREIHFIAIFDGFDELNPGERQKLIKPSSQLEDTPKLGCIVSSETRLSFPVLLVGPRWCPTLGCCRSFQVVAYRAEAAL